MTCNFSYSFSLNYPVLPIRINCSDIHNFLVIFSSNELHLEISVLIITSVMMAKHRFVAWTILSFTEFPLARNGVTGIPSIPQQAVGEDAPLDGFVFFARSPRGGNENSPVSLVACEGDKRSPHETFFFAPCGSVGRSLCPHNRSSTHLCSAAGNCVRSASGVGAAACNNVRSASGAGTTAAAHLCDRSDSDRSQCGSGATPAHYYAPPEHPAASGNHPADCAANLVLDRGRR